MKNTAARLINLLKPGETLSQRVVRGGFWVFALRLTNRLLGLASIMILARVLAPADFGLFGIAMLAMAALETFSQVGLNAALVQKKQDIAPYLDTAWTIQAIRGALLALVLFASAPYVAAFFDTPAATPILQVICLSVLIHGLTNIGVIYFHKELELHKQYAYELSGTLAHVGVAITAVLLLKSVWALVLGSLAGNLVRLAMSYVIHPYRPRPRLDLGQFQELFHFGKWVLGSSIIIYLIMQGDSILVGKLLGVAALGFYQMAYRIANMPASEITGVISQVTFPAYAKLQTDLPRLKEAYLKVLQLTAFLSFPLAGLIFVLASDITRILLGDKWLPMVPAMQVLVFFGLIRSLAATTGSLFLAFGKPHLLTKLALLQLGILMAIIYPLTSKFGIVGTSFALLIANFITQGVTTFIVVKLIALNVFDIAKLMAPPACTTIGVFLCIYFILPFLTISIFVVFGLTLFGILFYFGIIYILDKICDLNYRAIFNHLRLGI